MTNLTLNQGKTSLLVSMLGENTLRKGAMILPKHRIAYASQDVSSN